MAKYAKTLPLPPTPTLPIIEIVFAPAHIEAPILHPSAELKILQLEPTARGTVSISTPIQLYSAIRVSTILHFHLIRISTFPLIPPSATSPIPRIRISAFSAIPPKSRNSRFTCLRFHAMNAPVDSLGMPLRTYSAAPRFGGDYTQLVNFLESVERLAQTTWAVR
ncbi:hypothetical protein DFJ58DRAFT_734152 [Suillus subalutaceus]|uniref:uncharacterized protein n=1 Tax=Suillus subalutaceus TaxID=48586 RepID=UPI001B862EB9|nr:uncharacterized protein DFJ58DRAFT_734152 [Suillus subalutaceus]KAG1837774.1 hypothetical protein DFJ58DRAFT_734152 [Suillus subalutaceus]